jgi:hypothetical protein
VPRHLQHIAATRPFGSSTVRVSQFDHTVAPTGPRSWQRGC